MMAQNRIYLSPPHLTNKAQEYVAEAIQSNWIAPVGPFVDRFENALRSYTNVPGVLALNSGTSAIHLALMLANVSADDEVLCSTFTFAASAFPILYQKAKPVFIECEENTWNICPNTLEDAIRNRLNAGKKPKALILAHCYGNPSDMPSILEICTKYEIEVIEDAAEALGSTLNSRPMGTWANLGIYSFNGNKIITCSSGGALICKDSILAQKAKKIASQSKEPTVHFEHHSEGHNFLLSNILSAIGVSQFEVLNNRVEMRVQNFIKYKNFFEQIAGVRWQIELPGAKSNRWLSAFAFGANSNISSSYLLNELAAQNIESRPLWKPLHTQQAFSGCPYFGNHFSEVLFENGICLPSGGSSATDVVPVLSNLL